jgi:arginine-tRNA-protein transferase
MIQGVLAHHMTCRDFQDLVDRGFQRSGKFVYRPFMKQTCCPQYVFRTDITKFRLSKQQRATIRKMNNYLVQGHSSATSEVGDETECKPQVESEAVQSEGGQSDESGSSSKSEGSGSKKTKTVRPGLGADPNKPPCKKAKLLRKERRAKKAAEDSQSTATPEEGSEIVQEVAQPSDTPAPSQSSPPPSVAEWQEEKIAVPHAPSYTHTFSTRLVCCAPRDSNFIATYEESYQVFKKFQLGVHKDDIEECREMHFREFLVESPLSKEKAPEGAPCDYGSYHLQYLIDGKIFAVGVLDIIPKGVLCEYLYYDPAYRFIAPGVYSALYELSLAQKFYKVNPEMRYYYMGFYVQSCPKMNYKRQYSASELLCPETYKYVDLRQCIPRLKENGYCRLDDESPTVDDDDGITDDVMNNLMVHYNMDIMMYQEYRTLKGSIKDGMVRSYLQLMGKKVGSKSTLHIPDM